MAILKNEPVFNFEDGDYCKAPPHHWWREAMKGDRFRSRRTIAKNDYGCQLGNL